MGSSRREMLGLLLGERQCSAQRLWKSRSVYTAAAAATGSVGRIRAEDQSGASCEERRVLRSMLCSKMPCVP